MVVDLGTAGTSHLMRLMAYMVAMDVLSLAVLKTIDFVHLDETLVFPLQLFFAILLTHYPERKLRGFLLLPCSFLFAVVSMCQL